MWKTHFPPRKAAAAVVDGTKCGKDISVYGIIKIHSSLF